MRKERDELKRERQSLRESLEQLQPAAAEGDDTKRRLSTSTTLEDDLAALKRELAAAETEYAWAAAARKELQSLREKLTALEGESDHSLQSSSSLSSWI